MPLVPPAVSAKVMAANRRLGSDGSPARSRAAPKGSPLGGPEPLLICAKVAPPSVLRKMPMFAVVKLSAVLTATTRVLPRATMPEMFLPSRAPPPVIWVQVLPPSVVRSSPDRGPPSKFRELKASGLPLEKSTVTVSSPLPPVIE